MHDVCGIREMPGMHDATQLITDDSADITNSAKDIKHYC
jgi:hypothetical protein